LNKKIILALGLIAFIISIFLFVGWFSNVQTVKILDTINVQTQEPLSIVGRTINNNDFYLDVAKGAVVDKSVVHKFGANENVGTNWVVVSQSGYYQTPKTAKTISVVSDSVADDVGGIGAWQIKVYGLDSDFNEIQETVTLDGTNSVTLSNSYIRIFRSYIVSSGSYANQTIGSHQGTITFSDVDSNIWMQIGFIDGFPAGQTEMGAYTIPAGKTGYILSKHVIIESNKQIDVSMFKREYADDVTAGYSGAMRIIEHFHGLDDVFNTGFITPKGVLPEKTDIGFMAKTTSGTGSVSVEFEVLLVDN